MRVNTKSAWCFACYGGSYEQVKRLLKRDNKHVPARLRAKAFKQLKNDFDTLFEGLHEG